jgi:type II secretory pathway pseudopilin PulG
MPLSAISPSRTSSHRPGLRLRRGVTLVEVGIVMIILGLLAAMMIPKIGRGIASRELDRVSQQLVTDLRTAGQLATRHRRPVRFQAVGTTGYEIVDKATTTRSYVKRNFGALSGANATFGTLPTLEFYPNGVVGTTSSSVTFPVSLTVTVNGSSRQVTVSRVGYVRRP